MAVFFLPPMERRLTVRKAFIYIATPNCVTADVVHVYSRAKQRSVNALQLKC